MRDFRKFVVTDLSRALAVKVYGILESFPRDERYDFCRQLRRAVVSVGANIAEGAGRHTDKDFAHFLSQSIGSACEVEYLLLLATDLGFIEEKQRAQIDDDIQHVKSKLYRFRESLGAENPPHR
ncbi:MAG: four helix bundle protein [Bacteroidetes bacterium]|nr:four helix bundle protein [Bacteroidota bacterium]